MSATDNLITVHLSKSYAQSTIARVYKDAHVFEVMLPDFIVLNSAGFKLNEQIEILLKLGRAKEKLLVLATQKNCGIDL